MKVCNRCETRGKIWEGSDPKCAFPNGYFSKDNWNCATMNELRQRMEDKQLVKYSDDQNLAVFQNEGRFLIIGWYKSRGRTEYAGVLDTRMKPLTLKLSEEFISLLTSL